jgi:hypothetical protein
MEGGELFNRIQDRTAFNERGNKKTLVLFFTRWKTEPNPFRLTLATSTVYLKEAKGKLIA